MFTTVDNVLQCTVTKPIKLRCISTDMTTKNVSAQKENTEAEKPVSVSLRISSNLIEKLDRYKEEHKLDNRSAALRHILRFTLGENKND